MVFLDFSEEPEIGVSFAQYLAETIPSATIIGMGPTLPPNLLISAMDADVSRYLEVPLEAAAVVSTLKRLNVESSSLPETEPDPPRRRGRILHLFSPKGGCGATTITVNLAIALASEKAGRALIVDLDPELGDAALLLGVEPRFGVVDLVNSLGRFDASLLDSLVAKHESGVHLLSAPEDPQEVGLLSGRAVRNPARPLVAQEGDPQPSLVKPASQTRIRDSTQAPGQSVQPGRRHHVRGCPRRASPRGLPKPAERLRLRYPINQRWRPRS
ncbi:MAG: AAA family ATPase [Gemmatimonadales bacterium]